ncbi:MAG: hypothetical protein MZV63_42895 [Marinilabiliales bacterium]|nr:hypothetical protein [Marinilabiliales bacterium]
MCRLTSRLTGSRCLTWGLNTVGLERRGFSKEKMHELHEIYRAYYNMGMNGSQGAWSILRTLLPRRRSRDYILEFIKNSAEGSDQGALSPLFLLWQGYKTRMGTIPYVLCSHSDV